MQVINLIRNVFVILYEKKIIAQTERRWRDLHCANSETAIFIHAYCARMRK
jgi:hypothetical protein